jgi:hypothetical protein
LNARIRLIENVTGGSPNALNANGKRAIAANNFARLGTDREGESINIGRLT